ncbi:MAG: hypothetical protein KDC92_16620 [Bacteroidetes bacterium]|nr:hypothetical protein [Bacteroidota bacterium]
MKKLGSIFFFTFSLSLAYAQNFNSNFAWRWSVLNYTCPETVINYPAEVDNSNGPKCIETDGRGNVYLLGIMDVPLGYDYTLGANTTNATTYSQFNPFVSNARTSLYFMKIDKNGELAWSKDIVTAGIWEGSSLSLYIDTFSSIAHILVPHTGFEIIVNEDSIQTKGSPTLMSFNLNGKLVDTTWGISNIIPGDAGSFLYTKPGPWPQQFTVVKRTMTSESELKVFNYTVPNLAYNVYLNNYWSINFPSNSIDIYNTNLELQKRVQISGETPSLLGIDYNVAFSPNGSFAITYYNENDYANWMLYFDSNFDCKWYRKAGKIAAFDSKGNPWSYYPRVGPSAGLVDGKNIFPYNAESCAAIKLNAETGEFTGDFIAPTYTSHSNGSNNFSIDNKDRFYMAGTFWYEIEFGKQELSHTCEN